MNIAKFFLLILLIFCKKISIPVPDTEKLKNQSSYRNSGCVLIKNRQKELETNQWIRSYSISRFFYTNLENTTGSFKEILLKSLQSHFLSNFIELKEYDKSLCSDQTLILISIDELQTVWFPPQEFIQHIQPIRKGQLLFKININYKIENKNQSRQNQFNWNYQQFILPLEEQKSIERIYMQILREISEQVLKDYFSIKKN